MNFENTSVRFEVGNVYKDDADKLHSDLIGINAISLEANEAEDEDGTSQIIKAVTQDSSTPKV